MAHVFAKEKIFPLLSHGNYFSIYAYSGIDSQQLLEKINFSAFSQGYNLKMQDDSIRDILAKTFDAVYLEVSNALGINVYSFEGDIKIFPDQQSLNEEFFAIFGRDFSERAFYVHEKSTLYFSFEDLTLGVLVHEMAHMIMSNYFVVPPSEKLQEILSGYAEYHFRDYL